jgi:hypothetical protein
VTDFDAQRFARLARAAVTDPSFADHNALMVAAEEWLTYFTPEPGDTRTDLARKMAFAAQAFAFHETEDARLGLKRASDDFYRAGPVG